MSGMCIFHFLLIFHAIIDLYLFFFLGWALAEREGKVYKLFVASIISSLLLPFVVKNCYLVCTLFSCHSKTPQHFLVIFFFLPTFVAFVSYDDRPHTGKQPEVVDRQVKRYAKKNSNYLIKSGQPRQPPPPSSLLQRVECVLSPFAI